jgi:transposase
MTPASQEKRELIVTAKLRGEFTKDIEKWIGVSKSTIDKVWKLHAETEDCSTIPYRGRKSCITLEIKEKIENTIRANPDITLAELIEELKFPIGVSRPSQILKSWRYSLKKKTLHPTTQKRKDVIKKRSQ